MTVKSNLALHCKPYHPEGRQCSLATGQLPGGLNGGPDPTDPPSWQVHPSFLMLLSALLGHPSTAVRTVAAAATRQLALLSPTAALGVLPVVLFQLQRSISAAAAASLPGPAQEGAAGEGGGQEEAWAMVALLQVLPALGGDGAVQPFALRALQPLMAPGGCRCLPSLVAFDPLNLGSASGCLLELPDRLVRIQRHTGCSHPWCFTNS